MPTEPTVEEEWYKMLTEGEPIPRQLYHLHGLLPSDPRCKLCASPFKGWILKIWNIVNWISRERVSSLASMSCGLHGMSNPTNEFNPERKK